MRKNVETYERIAKQAEVKTYLCRAVCFMILIISLFVVYYGCAEQQQDEGLPAEARCRDYLPVQAAATWYPAPDTGIAGTDSSVPQKTDHVIFWY